MTEPATPAHFEALHRSGADPWGVRSRWYERRKRALLLAVLPREHYRFGFEPGCSIGANSAVLAERCDRLLATDASPAAIEQARLSVGLKAPGLTFAVARLPHTWPSDWVDLLVISELAYYLPEDDLETVLAAVPHRLEEGGHFVMCHWRAPIADAHSNGDAVHALAARRLTQSCSQVGGWCDADMRIDVWQVGMKSASVAQREGAQETRA